MTYQKASLIIAFIGLIVAFTFGLTGPIPSFWERSTKFFLRVTGSSQDKIDVREKYKVNPKWP